MKEGSEPHDVNAVLKDQKKADEEEFQQWV